jgi:hypothetical protein
MSHRPFKFPAVDASEPGLSKLTLVLRKGWKGFQKDLDQKGHPYGEILPQY